MKFRNLHPWDLSPKVAIALQNKLRQEIKLRNFPAHLRLVAGADAAFKNKIAIGAIAVMDLIDFKLIECVRKTAKISYPYIPGLLTFREGPVLEKCFRALKSKPEVIIFDGQGISHPRNMGIATHLGILLDKPTIGCAKTHLFGDYVEPKEWRGAFSYLLDKRGRKIGAVLRTKDKTRAVYVSPGYKMDIAGAIRLILMCTKKYRLPQPLRIAHHLTLDIRPFKIPP